MMGKTADKQIKRDRLELKQELGLGHDGGSGWRGFHRRQAPAHRHQTRPATAPMAMLPTGFPHNQAMQFMTLQD